MKFSTAKLGIVSFSAGRGVESSGFTVGINLASVILQCDDRLGGHYSSSFFQRNFIVGWVGIMEGQMRTHVVGGKNASSISVAD